MAAVVRTGGDKRRLREERGGGIEWVGDYHPRSLPSGYPSRFAWARAPRPAHARTPAASARTCARGDFVHAVAPGLVSDEPYKGFDPARVSAAQLECYGYFGTRPPAADPAALALWIRQARRLRYVVPRIDAAKLAWWDAYFRQHPAILRPRSQAYPVERNPVWSGEEVRQEDNNGAYFTSVASYWTVPAMTLPGGNYAISTWVGLGGDYVHRNPNCPANQDCEYPDILWQAGISSYGDPQYAPFIQDAGCEDDRASGAPCPNGGLPIPFLSPSINPGDLVFVSVDAAHGTYLIADYTTSQSTGLQAEPVDNNYTGVSAEWILEEPPCPGVPGGSPCNNGRPFTNPHFYQAEATGNGSERYIDHWNWSPEEVCVRRSDASYIIAEPSGVDPASHGFDVYSENRSVGNIIC